MILRQMKVIILLCIFYSNIYSYANAEGLIEVFQWKQIDYYNRGNGVPTPPNKGSDSGKIIFPGNYNYRSKRNKNTMEVITSRDQPITTNARFGFENNSSYVAYNNVPMGVSHYKGRIFVTVPRRRVGIPSTLNFIDMRKDGNKQSPKLSAYPNFDINYLDPNLRPNSQRIISVYRTTVDQCKRLWFIDTGMLEYPNNRTQIQRPSIWIIDLTTDRLVRRFEIPENVVQTGQGLASITVDINAGRCGQAFAYLPDLVNSRLYVYSFENNRMWAFSHNYFNFDPLGGDLSIGGQRFRWNDGIFSTTLGPQNPNGDRNVYFHAMASNNEFFVPNTVLQNEANAERSDHDDDFQLLGSRGINHQSTMHSYDSRTGVIFYDEIQKNGVGCWNTKMPFSESNHGTVAQDAQRMIYPSDLTIDEDGNIWVMTNSMPIFIYDSLDPNEVNFRIWKQNVYEAIKNTVCE